VWFVAPQAGRPADLERLERLIGADRTLLLQPAGGLEGDPFALAPAALPTRVDVLVVAVWFWFRPSVFSQLVPLFSLLWPTGRVLALSDDCHHARQALIARQNSHTGGKYVGSGAPSPMWLLAQERAYYERADWVVFIAERDRELCSRNISVLARKGRVARTGPHTPPAPGASGQLAALAASAGLAGVAAAATAAAAEEVVFLGRADNPTNFVAVQNFLNEVWPAVHEALPRLRLRLVGDACAPHEECHWTKNTRYEGVPAEQSGVHVAGFVPRLADALAGRLALVMPIFWSTGVNTKFYRALEFGVPTLITPVSAKSLGLTDGGGDAVFVCAGLADCWVDSLRLLAGNATLRAAMGDAAAALGATLYQADEERTDFAAVLAEVEQSV
jgi:hypothetical protein